MALISFLLIFYLSEAPPLEGWIKVKVKKGFVTDLVIKKRSGNFITDHKVFLNYLLNHAIEPKVRGTNKSRREVYALIQEDEVFNRALKCLNGQIDTEKQPLASEAILERSTHFIAESDKGPYLCIYPDSVIRMNLGFQDIMMDAFCFHVLHRLRKEMPGDFKRALRDPRRLTTKNGAFADLVAREYQKHADSLPFVMK